MNVPLPDQGAAPEVRPPASAGTLAGPKARLAPVLLDVLAAETVAMSVGSVSKRTAAAKRMQAVAHIASVTLQRFHVQLAAERAAKREAVALVGGGAGKAKSKVKASKAGVIEHGGVS